MRAIPSEVAALLKSRSTIGENKPSCEVAVDTGVIDGNMLYAFNNIGDTDVAGAGWSFTDNTIWVTSNKACKYNPLTGVLLDSFNLSRKVNGCEIDGDNSDVLWTTVDNSNEIDKYILSTKNRIATFSLQSKVNGIAAPKGDYLWIGIETLPYRLAKIKKSDGTTVLTYNIDFRPSGVAWDGKWVWVSGYSTKVQAYNPLTGVKEYEFNGPSGELTSLTYDGLHLWSGDNVLNRVIKFARSSVNLLKIKSISISRNKNMAGNLSLSIDNKNGEWSPDNIAHQNVLFPNKEITIRQGYGGNLIQTFIGLIDRIEMTTFPQELKLSVRDKLKLALDQTITWTDGATHVILFQSQPIETIFSMLCDYAGLATGTIETTGISITKTFSWETYADCFQWLADLVVFEYGADENGLMYFRKDITPATPIIAYEFKEGEDIISLGYTIDDNDIYSKVVVYGKDANDNVIFAQKEYVSKAYYNVLPQKFLKIDVSEASTVEQLQAIADRAEMLMRSRVREVSFVCLAVPWLQVGDIIRVIESSTTISELYRITDLSTNMDSGGYTMQITCYHHSV